MKRSKFPYTARSSARVIRHAVSIDERRAKFRSDLMSSSRSPHPRADSQRRQNGEKPHPDWPNPHTQSDDRFRRRSAFRPDEHNKHLSPRLNTVDTGHLDPRRGTMGDIRSPSPGVSRSRASNTDASSINSDAAMREKILQDDDDDDDEEAPQDLEEIWFPGCHADLGGGWPLAKGEEAPLSHGPLVWMVREAQRAGLEFDAEKMLHLKCCDEDYNISSLGIQQQAYNTDQNPDVPAIEVTNIFNSPHSEKEEPGWAPGLAPSKPSTSAFHEALHNAFTKGHLHDCLEFRNGLPPTNVLSWKIMEYLPFRRMDLRPDGSWKAISLPLPMGETRDIPEDAWIHHSAIRRMEADPRYRPGNLIIGGGGRGVRRAPEELGIGEWEVLKAEGDPVGMVYVRKGPSLEKKIDKETHPRVDSQG